MARQEQIFAQTITDMKRAMLRKGDDSESDDLIDKPTNRGNKLKRKAKFVEEGRLDLANSVQAYRKKINYNGFFREVISKNPVRVDPDGDIVDDAEDDSAADIESLEEDPYSEIKIEQLLMPLTSAAELHNHPSLSMPYKCKILDEMVQNAQDMLFREEDSLWRIKQLTNEFRGDSTWMPAGNFQTADDISLLGLRTAQTSVAPSITGGGDILPRQSSSWDALSSAQLIADLEEAAHNEAQKPAHLDASIATMDYVPHDAYEAPVSVKQFQTKMDEQMDNSLQDEEQGPNMISPNNATNANGDKENAEKESHLNGDSDQTSPKHEDDVEQSSASQDNSGAKNDHNQSSQQEPYINGETNHEPEDEENPDDDAADEDEASHPPHRMTTRAKAQAATSPNSNSPGQPSSPSNPMFYIHPFFIPPQTALSTKEAGLPYDEADETRRLVCAYVQKQEEVCRGASKLYNGLLRAKKMRDDVLEWCRAEGHIGEMSDGEDWYDREKWDLTEDLKKGEEMDEEEANVTGKKTRHRRSARDA